MFRVSLPFRGVAVVLLCASAAAGQTSLPATAFSDELLGAAPSMAIWQPSFGRTRLPTDDFYAPYTSPIRPVAAWYETEMTPTLETGEDADPPAPQNLAAVETPAPQNLAAVETPAPKESADPKTDSKDANRLTPTPTPGSQGTSPQTAPLTAGGSGGSGPLAAESCGPFCDGSSGPFVADGACDGLSGPFVADGGFPCAPTFLPFACPPCSWHKCRRKHRHCCAGGGCGYASFGGFCGCPSFCAPPPCCGRRCHFGHHCRKCAAAPCGMGMGMGCGGFMGCDGFMGPSCSGFCPPPMPACSCRRCHRKHACYYSGCGGYGGFGGGYGGFGDGFGAFDGLCCYGGCNYHRCGLFHRCHARKCAPMPCFCPCYGFGMPLCMGMDGMGMGMSMGGMGMGMDGMGMGMDGMGMGMSMGGMGMDGMSMGMGMGMGGGFCPSCSMP